MFIQISYCIKSLILFSCLKHKVCYICGKSGKNIPDFFKIKRLDICLGDYTDLPAAEPRIPDAEGKIIYPNGLSNSLPRSVQEEMVRSVPGLERAVFLALEETPMGLDDLADLTSLSPSQVMTAVTMLELKDLAVTLPGDRVVIKN